MSRIDQYAVRLTARDGTDYGSWQTFAGGGVDSQEAFTRDGYGLAREPLGGPADVQNFTMTRTYRIGRDPLQYQKLRKSCGRVLFDASVQLLDIDGFVVGAPEAYVGMLKATSKADVDIEGSAAMKVTVEFTGAGKP